MEKTVEEQVKEKQIEKAIQTEVKKAEEATEPKAEVATEVATEVKTEVKEEPKEAVTEEKKEEVVVEEKKEEVAEEGTKVADAKVGEEKVEKKEQKVEKTEEKTISVKVDASELKAVLADIAKEFKGISDKMTETVENLQKKAISEKGADAETPKEVAKAEAPKEEVIKSETSSEGASKEILKALGDIKERLTAIEAQPVQGAAVVYTKSFAGLEVSEDFNDIDAINKRLEELKKMKVENPMDYMNEGGVNEAFALIRKKKLLQSKK